MPYIHLPLNIQLVRCLLLAVVVVACFILVTSFLLVVGGWVVVGCVVWSFFFTYLSHHLYLYTS